LLEVPLRLRSVFLLAPAVALLLAAPLLSQTANTLTQGPIPVFKTNARAVVVDVVVTKGVDEPVKGLHKQDFEVFEDGKPQTIDFFEEHIAKTLPPGALPAPPPMPPNVYTNVPVVPLSDSVNVLLLDSLNTEKQDQSYVHRQILNFLKTMQPGTRAAIFTLGSKLRFVQGFTTDSSALVAALNDPKTGVTAEKDASAHTASDIADEKEQIATMRAMLGGRSDAGVEAVTAAMADYSQFQRGNRIMMTLEALQYLARYLGGVPGRKNLIWFAGEFPITVFPTNAQRETMSQIRVYGSAVKQTADMLTVSKVAVYPINAQGMMVEHGMEADSAGPSHMGGIGAYGQEAGDRSETIYAMEQLAADTGGKAFYNTNDLNGAMTRAINDGSYYYTIVYTPTNKKMDGQYRRIEIKSAAGHYKLAYRRGYNADNSLAQEAQPEADPLRPLLVRGLPSATELLYGVRVIPADPQPAPNATRAGKNPKLTGPFTRYVVDFMVRWTDVKFEAAPQGAHTGRIQVGLLAYDRDGNAVNWVGASQGMNLNPEIFAAIQKSGVPAHLEIDLPNTDVYLETGVYDWGSGKAGTLEIPLHPKAAAAAPANAPATR
jgi:VWFA-related protein